MRPVRPVRTRPKRTLHRDGMRRQRRVDDPRFAAGRKTGDVVKGPMAPVVNGPTGPVVNRSRDTKTLRFDLSRSPCTITTPGDAITSVERVRTARRASADGMIRISRPSAMTATASAARVAGAVVTLSSAATAAQRLRVILVASASKGRFLTNTGRGELFTSVGKSSTRRARRGGTSNYGRRFPQGNPRRGAGKVPTSFGGILYPPPDLWRPVATTRMIARNCKACRHNRGRSGGFSAARAHILAADRRYVLGTIAMVRLLLGLSSTHSVLVELRQRNGGETMNKHQGGGDQFRALLPVAILTRRAQPNVSVGVRATSRYRWPDFLSARRGFRGSAAVRIASRRQGRG